MYDTNTINATFYLLKILFRIKKKKEYYKIIQNIRVDTL